MTEGEAKVIPEEDILGEPIEILVNLAKNGEIDPWNINIVELTDKFLKMVDNLEKMDLRVSGRTLLYASILLRMKSNALVEVEEPPEEIDLESDNFEISDYPVPSMPLRRYSKRPVTLEELLTELKKAEAFEKKRLNRVENKRDEIRATLDDVLSVAHEEDIESRIGKMRYILNELLEKQKSIKFSEISSTLDRTGILMAYLAILFLATKKEIWIEQEEFFGELFISRSAS